jgi:hypothetical protein
VRRVRGGSGRRWWVAVSVAVVAAVVAGTWWLLTRDTRGAEIATVLALPVAILSLGTAVIAAVVTLRTGAAESDTLLSAARQLAGAVRAQESAALARLVADTGDTRPADVAFTQPGLLYWRSDGGAHRGSLAQIEAFYRGLGRGRLVVLGEAGAGKTVLVIQLIRDLATSVVNTSSSPERSRGRVVVPVRLSLPAFDPASGDDYLDDVAGEHLARRLDQWVAGHLVTVYGLTEKIAAALVTGGWVLPVLDGLDEMDPVEQWPRRAVALVRAVNHPTADGMRPVILTCRTSRYAQLTGHPLVQCDGEVEAAAGAWTVGVGATSESVVVQDATVVGIEPLSVSDVIAYLSYRFPDPGGSGRCEPRWAPVLDQLAVDRAGDPVVVALRSPLRLFLAVTGYRRVASDPGVLTQYDSAGQLDDHLFGLLVPALTAQHPRPTGGHYPAADVQRWLTTLARHLHRQGEAERSGTDLRLDELWPAAGDHAPRYLTAALLTVASLAVVTTALQQVRLSWNAASALALMGLVMVFVPGTVWRSLRRSVGLVRIDFGALGTTVVRRRLAFMLAGWLALMLAGGLLFGFGRGFAIGFGGGFVGVLAGGLMAGLTTLPVSIDLPHRVVSQGLAHTACMLAGGLAVGLAIGLGGGLVVGLAVGFTIGIFCASGSPWPRYAIACLLLAGGVHCHDDLLCCWIGPTTPAWCGYQGSQCNSGTGSSRTGS